MDDHVSKTVAVYNRIAPIYAQKIKELPPELERQKFASYLKPKSNVLDIGCAAGRDSQFFAQKGFVVTGVDLSEKLLDIAKKTVKNVTFVKQDIRNLSFPPESFDGIWASAVLLHLKRRELPDVVKKIHQALSKNGVFFFSLKKGKGEHNVTEALAQEQPRFFTFYEENELKHILSQAGFTLLEMYTWNGQDRAKNARDIDWISCFTRKV